MRRPSGCCFYGGLSLSLSLSLSRTLRLNKSALLRLSHIFFQFGSRMRARGTRAAAAAALSFDIWGFIWQHHAPMGAPAFTLAPTAAADK